MIVIEKKISPDMVDKAVSKAIQMGQLNNSITKGKGNISGFLGEEIVKNFLHAEEKNSYDYDIVLPNKKTIDVKTKRTTVKPKKFYECSIAAYNIKQKCDCYIFCRILNDMSKGWVLGYMEKEEYFNKATLLKKGQVDPSNNFTVKADCYNLPISKLRTDWEELNALDV